VPSIIARQTTVYTVHFLSLYQTLWSTFLSFLLALCFLPSSATGLLYASLPFLDSVICSTTYQGLHSGGTAFFRFVAFLFLAILTAESQVLVIASLLPVFVAALAIGAL
jgi:hypothetical protein